MVKRRTPATKRGEIDVLSSADPSPADAVVRGKRHDRMRAIAPTLIASLIADVPPPYPPTEPVPLTRKQRQELARKQRQQETQVARATAREEKDDKGAPKVQRDTIAIDGATIRAPRVERDGLVFKRSTPLVHLAKRSEGMEAPTITAAHVRAASRLSRAWEMAGEGIGVGASNYGERLGGGTYSFRPPASLGFQPDAQREIAGAHAWLGALWPAIYAVVIQGMDVTAYAAKAKMKDRKLALGYVRASLDRLVEFYKPRVDVLAIVTALESGAPGIRSAIVVPNATDPQNVDNDGPSRA